MEIFIAALLFIIGLVCIVKGGDWFVDSAAWLAEVTGIPKFIVGATIVSVATTIPEMLVSVMAAAQSGPDYGHFRAVYPLGYPARGLSAQVGAHALRRRGHRPGWCEWRDHRPPVRGADPYLLYFPHRERPRR